MEKSILFQNWHQWQVCFVSGWKKFLWGFGRIVTCILLGVVSFIVWLWKCACRWVGRHPNIALGGFIVVAILIFVLMFARNRAKMLGLEAQRDSIAWQYQNFKESHGYDE